MATRLALIGFGEAGSTFAAAAGWGAAAWAFDIDPARRAAMIDHGVRPAASTTQALATAPVVLSLVTADQALAAAREAAPGLAPEALWCDMNSVAPETKRAAARAVEAAGGRYLDVAVMAPVSPAHQAVPLRVSGPHAAAGVAALGALGFTDVAAVGDTVGRASAIKLLRSVLYKGLEALTAECLIGAQRAGVLDEVLDALDPDWSAGAYYRLDRMLVHGRRRAEEMREAAAMLAALGVEPLLTRGTIARQRQLGERLRGEERQGNRAVATPATLRAMLELLET